MSRFLNRKYEDLEPYVPGEQPQDQKYLKLNTNESPFPPSKKAQAKAAEAAEKLHLYSDPDCRALAEKLAERLSEDSGVKLTRENVIITNGSDEALNFAFMAFCGGEKPAVFPDITYGFYPVFADMNGVPYREIPLDEEFRIDPADYAAAGGTIFIANPNAHTGVALSRGQIKEILAANPEDLVVVDEAYVDFGAESSLPLLEKYENLLVVQTFSKSRSLAGGRLGFAAASGEIITDLQTIRFSTNPYNVNSMTMSAGIGVLEDEEETRKNRAAVIVNRRYTEERLRAMGFELTDSSANFIFMKHPEIDGGR
ncbi:MAG: pyridoxal phosphate-dependent aminotransferase, partial [Bacillota bacterium]